jgi:23S rRNA (cytosine1962-C5)-methyltransferase
VRELVLLPGKQRSVEARHQWIFSGAVKKIPSDVPDGGWVDVVSASGQFLGQAFINRKSSIIGRIVSFQSSSAEQAIRENIARAVALRKAIFGDLQGKMYRVVNAEADLLSGLVVDIYDKVAVVQISSLGMERHKNLVVDALLSELSLSWIYEKSTSPSRTKEGLKTEEKSLYGQEVDRVVVEERGMKFFVDIKGGQKTGFFLDQREMRHMVEQVAKDRHVLNCFSYSGGFSVAALRGGALSCCSIDSSQPALDLLRENLAMNGLAETAHSEVCEDVFSWLDSQPIEATCVILDPPAFAKRKQEADRALRGYKEINRRVLQKIPAGSFLLTFSCSYHVETTQFMAMLKAAALDAKRPVQLLSYHRHAWDHPTSLFHPETEYLKSALLYVS